MKKSVFLALVIACCAANMAQAQIVSKTYTPTGGTPEHIPDGPSDIWGTVQYESSILFNEFAPTTPSPR